MRARTHMFNVHTHTHACMGTPTHAQQSQTHQVTLRLTAPCTHATHRHTGTLPHTDVAAREHGRTPNETRLLHSQGT
eukprot:7293340-Alexandrium_andersonii.AAC.1